MGELPGEKVVKEMISGVEIPLSSSALGADAVLRKVKRLAVTVRCKYHGSATAGVTVYLYTGPDGQNRDTDPLTSFEPSFTAGALVQKTVFIDPDANRLWAKVTNKDTSYQVDDVYLWATLTMEGGE